MNRRCLIRKAYLIRIVAIALIMTGACTKSSMAEDKEGPAITITLFTENDTKTGTDIEVSYPQFNGFRDAALQNNINALLKNEALRNYESPNGLSLQINYEIAYLDNKTISVIYFGSAFRQGAFHPMDIFTTININLESGERIRLDDIVEVNDMFVEKLRNDLKKYIRENPDLEPAYSATLLKDNDQLLDLMQQADSETAVDCFSYYTKDFLGISFSTYYVAGDHYEIKMLFSDIGDY